MFSTIWGICFSLKANPQRYSARSFGTVLARSVGETPPPDHVKSKPPHVTDNKGSTSVGTAGARQLRPISRGAKSRIQAAQLRASLAVNRELVLLYWQIGRGILGRQEREKWGAKVIDRLATDLKRSFPDLSPRNLKYMRAFAEAWPEEPIVQAGACTNHLVPQPRHARKAGYVDTSEDRARIRGLRPNYLIAGLFGFPQSDDHTPKNAGK